MREQKEDRTMAVTDRQYGAIAAVIDLRNAQQAIEAAYNADGAESIKALDNTSCNDIVRKIDKVIADIQREVKGIWPNA